MYTVHNTTILVMTTETMFFYANKLFYRTTHLTAYLMDEENGLLSGIKNTTPNIVRPLPVYYMLVLPLLFSCTNKISWSGAGGGILDKHNNIARKDLALCLCTLYSNVHNVIMGC